MSTEYWNKTHIEKYSKSVWVTKPSVFAEQCVEFLPKKGTLLEIGTGQGGDAEFFNSLGFDVTATDYSEDALKIAEARVKNIHFLNVDTAAGLPFENEMFDVVYSHMALHYFDTETTREVFKDIYRILKPNGVFAAITNTMNDPEKEEYNYIELEPGYYQDPKGIKKRYFSVDDMKRFTAGLFEPLLVDANGTTYKDHDSNLIRFVGRKL